MPQISEMALLVLMANCGKKKTVKVNEYHVLLSDSNCSESFHLLYHVITFFRAVFEKEGEVLYI